MQHPRAFPSLAATLAIALAACVEATAPAEPSTKDVASRASQQSCAMWMTYLQCDHYMGAMAHLSAFCPEVVAHVGGASYSVYYDQYNRELYGYSSNGYSQAMWLTSMVFEVHGEMANTIAHEYAHNIGMNETDANTFGNSCGAGSLF